MTYIITRSSSQLSGHILIPSDFARSWRKPPHPQSCPLLGSHSMQWLSDVGAIKAWPPQPNTGQLQKATPAPALPVGSAKVFVVTVLWLDFHLCPDLLLSLCFMFCSWDHFPINDPPRELDMKQITQNKHLDFTHVVYQTWSLNQITGGVLCSSWAVAAEGRWGRCPVGKMSSREGQGFQASAKPHYFLDSEESVTHLQRFPLDYTTTGQEVSRRTQFSKGKEQAEAQKLQEPQQVRPASTLQRYRPEEKFFLPISL